jgi:hypothetical protein
MHQQLLANSMRSNERERAVGRLDLRGHWENIYRTKGEHEVGWFEQTPAVSLDLIQATGVMADGPAGCAKR